MAHINTPLYLTEDERDILLKRRHRRALCDRKKKLRKTVSTDAKVAALLQSIYSQKGLH